MHLLRVMAFGLMVAVSTLAAPSTASAAADMIIKQADQVHAEQTVDVVGLLDFIGTMRLGVGGWYGIPIMPQGFIQPINDAFFIEFGAYLEHDRYSWGAFGYDCTVSWNRLSPLGGVRWNFYLTPDWTVFATTKMGYGIGFGDSVSCDGTYGSYSNVDSGVDYSEFIVDGSAGAYWNFSEAWSMRLELSYIGPVVGAGFKL